MIGTRLLHYEVLEKLGEGGMGVVYKARDTRLDRFVALKVLPPEKVSDPDRKRRFIQEAKAASALNHPSIITIHDIDHVDGTDFIGMEYVAGKTLSELIPRKGMRLNEVLKYSVQIADALAAAHAAGIVHRDLKPANVMVTQNGLVKVLDFGLAKLTERAEPDASATTETLEPRTEEGTILGTVVYMSPEQAEGENVDARSDIFSLGSVLYEMLTGQKAFQGTSKMATLSMILHQDPKPVSRITPAIPADLEKLISRCLRKDPQRRWQTMADLKVALDELKEDSNSGRLQATPAAAKQVTSVRLVIGAFAVVVLVALGWYWLGRQRRAEPEAPLVAVPLTSYAGREVTPSFSPDGRQVAFQWCTEGPSANCDIYIKQIGVEPPFRLTSNPAEDFSPAWSPDGQFIAFLRRLSTNRAALMLIPQRGGQERVLEELDLTEWNHFDSAVAPYVGWSADSKWLVLPSAGPGKDALGLSLVSMETLEKRRLTTPLAGSCDTTPAVSPDGRTLAFTRMSGGRSGICFLSLGKNYEPQGEPPRLVTPEEQPSSGVAWTPDGSDIVYCYGPFGGGGLWRMAASTSGKPVRLAFASNATSGPAISRQGNRLAYEVQNWDINVYRVDLSGPTLNPGMPSKLISSTKYDGLPAYSPDGKKIAFSSDRSGSWEIWVCNFDGSNAVQLTSLRGEDNDGATWSPDGRSIAFGLVVGGKRHVFVANANGGVPRSLTTDPIGYMTWPSWSRDGRWIYFRSRRTGSSAIWKMPAAGGDAVQITPNGHERDVPQESPDGKFLYYINGDRYPEQLSGWRMPARGGEETRVLDATAALGSFAVVEQGIYFAMPPDEQGRCDISLRDLTTGKTRKIVTVVGRFAAVSPDGRTILYEQQDEAGSDLMLVENFR
jgi:Tol biopolymer transport system component/predicted Ser/Thr protein kinase